MKRILAIVLLWCMTANAAVVMMDPFPLASNQKPMLGISPNWSHWSMDGIAVDYLFNSNSGSIALDSGGNGNDLSFAGNAQWVVGQHGPAISFDGTDDWLANTSAVNLPTDKCTIMFWVRSPNWDIQQVFVSMYNDGATSQLVMYTTTAGTGTLYLYTPPANAISASNIGSYTSPNIWHHIAATWNQADYTAGKIYIDGRDVTTATVSTPAASSLTNIRIGADDGGDNDFTGQMSSVRIYNKYVSKDAVQSNMADTFAAYRSLPIMFDAGSSAGQVIMMRSW